MLRDLICACVKAVIVIIVSSKSSDASTASPSRSRQLHHDSDIRMAALMPIAEGSRLFSYDRVHPAAAIALETLGTPEKMREQGPMTAGEFGEGVRLASGKRLSIAYRDSNCSEVFGMKEAIDFYVSGPVHVYLGPVCDYGAGPVARQAIFWNTAVITTGALALDFHMRRRDVYPTTTRAGLANIVDMTLALQAIQDRLKWSRLFVLYERHGQEEVMPLLCHLLAETVVYKMKEKSVLVEYLTLEHDWMKKIRLDLVLTEKIGNKFAGWYLF